MKTCFLKWLLSAMILLLCFLGFKLGVRNYEPSIEAPAGIRVEWLDDGNIITWNQADYATAYRVFRRKPQHDWTLLTETEERSFFDADPSVFEEEYEYAVKVLHSSVFCEKLLSGYSKAVRTHREETAAGAGT